jgi:predicted transcriptional regulator
MQQMDTAQTKMIKDYMATSLVRLAPQLNVYDSITLLIKHKISGAPVVDRNEKLIGVLSEKDCLRILANGSFHDLPAGEVKDYMSTNCFTLRADDDVFRAADIFLHHNFRRIPVTDENEKLVGQISRRDVLRAIQDASDVKSPDAFPSKYLSDEMKASLED